MCAHFSTYTQCRIPYCYTGGFICAGATQGELPEGQERVPWGDACVAQFVSLEITDSTHEDKLCQTDRFAGAFRYNVPKNCATRLCRALRNVADMCSSTLSANCEKAEKDTQR